MEIQYAKECVRQGLPVFPAAPDKSPLTAHGFENASLNRIIKKAGISKGAMYYYFDDKMDLYIQ